MEKRKCLTFLFCLILCYSLFQHTARAQSSSQISISSQGSIARASETLLRAVGTKLYDSAGEVYLKGVIVDWNERVKKYGTLGVANSPEESWFTIDDVRRLKEAGANLVEIHLNPLTHLMPARNVVDEAYFTTWVDKWVAWTEQYEMYCILDITGIGARWGWEISLTFPNWLWEGLYSTPTTKAEYDAIMRDFFDLNVVKQDINREAFTNLWKFIANRYKNNPYVTFSIINEPFCGADFMGPHDSNIALAQSYSTYMERIVDAIRSTGAKQVVFINKPYLWDSQWRMAVQPVNRDNIVWEDHAYVGNEDLVAWKNYVDQYVQRFVYDFGKPLFIGEYSIYPHGIFHTTYASNWRIVLADMVSYLDSGQLCGRLWHNYGALEGEYYDHVYDYFTAEESEDIIQIVSGD